MQKQESSNHNDNPTQREDYSYINNEVPKEVVVDCDLLMLFDSNGQYLKPDKFHREDKCQYERVIKINYAVEMVKKAKINKAPKKILINVGLNDVDENTDIIEMISEYKKLLSSVHEKMPESKIYLS